MLYSSDTHNQSHSAAVSALRHLHYMGSATVSHCAKICFGSSHSPIQHHCGYCICNMGVKKKKKTGVKPKKRLQVAVAQAVTDVDSSN